MKKTKVELEIENELLRAEIKKTNLDLNVIQDRHIYAMNERDELRAELVHQREQHRLLNICACNEERRAEKWKDRYGDCHAEYSILGAEYDALNTRLWTLDGVYAELQASYKVLQDIDIGLRADLSRTQDNLRDERALVQLLRKNICDHIARYDALDFSMNESVKKSSAYQTLAHEHETLKAVLRSLGLTISPTPP